jgi:predicted porin
MAPASAAPDGTVLAYSNIAFCHTITDGIGGDCNGITDNVVRYDSPTFCGFSVSVLGVRTTCGMSRPGG